MRPSVVSCGSFKALSTSPIQLSAAIASAKSRVVIVVVAMYIPAFRSELFLLFILLVICLVLQMVLHALLTPIHHVLKFGFLVCIKDLYHFRFDAGFLHDEFSHYL